MTIRYGSLFLRSSRFLVNLKNFETGDTASGIFEVALSTGGLGLGRRQALKSDIVT